MNVPFQFVTLIRKIQPTPGEVGKAKMHASTIRARLQKSFNLKKFEFIGSHSKGTATRDTSDLDLLALFSREEARWGDSYKSSQTFISNIRDDLSERYPATVVRRDQQAVVVQFGAGSRSVDVVPAIFWGFTQSKKPLYYIPDGERGWMPTSPDSHTAYLIEADARSGGKLKRVIQLIKYWKHCRMSALPLSSFHLELVLAQCDISVGAKSYAECIFDSFYLLAQRQCRGIHDPLGISGTIDASDTDAKRNTLFSAVQFSRDHAWDARQAELKGNHREAVRQWNIVFNDGFTGR
jgi:hypothetical protein